MRSTSIWLASLCLWTSGCFSPAVDSNRGMWQGFLANEKGNDTVTFGVASAEVARDDYGLQVLARDVLDQPMPEGAQRRDLTRGGTHALSVSTDQDDCRNYVLGAAGERVVPEELARTTFLRDYTKALTNAKSASDTATDVTLSRSDVFEFGREAYSLSTDARKAEKTSAGRLLRMYMSVYLKGEFVDRRGRQLARPSIIQTGADGKVSVSVSGEIIAALASVALEAVLDAAFQTPVLYKQESSKVYLTEGQRVPTFAQLLGIEQPIVANGESQGITEIEHDLMQYVSDLAGFKSKALASLVIGLFKETKIEFILGADFAIGDNEALRRLVEALFDVGSRKISEELAFEALSHFEYTKSGSRITPVAEDDNLFGRSIALLLQEQQLLKNLYPAK